MKSEEGVERERGVVSKEESGWTGSQAGPCSCSSPCSSALHSVQEGCSSRSSSSAGVGWGAAASPANEHNLKKLHRHHTESQHWEGMD